MVTGEGLYLAGGPSLFFSITIMDPKTDSFCKSISGRLGSIAYFGHNQYGPWVSDQPWLPGSRPGTGDVFEFMMDELIPIWISLTNEELETWNSRANRYKISRYCAFVMVNASRYTKSLDLVRIDT